jgi:hypothetical protein
MTPEEREEMDRLCKLVATEKDPTKFDQYVRQLNDLLEEKHKRIHPEHTRDSK